ncbi:hypothetical protein ACF1G0_06615 [Streptomyces sp. NPDC013953]
MSRDVRAAAVDERGTAWRSVDEREAERRQWGRTGRTGPGV